MKFRRKKRAVSDVEEFDMTSLLDILVILLIFLLKSFSDSDLTVELADELALPYSMSRMSGHNGVTLQVDQSKTIYINKEKLGNLEDSDTLIKIGKALKNEYSRISKTKNNSKKINRKLINLIFDKHLKYGDINQIMEISSEAGFGLYKLIVFGDE